MRMLLLLAWILESFVLGTGVAVHGAAVAVPSTAGAVLEMLELSWELLGLCCVLLGLSWVLFKLLRLVLGWSRHVVRLLTVYTLVSRWKNKHIC